MIIASIRLKNIKSYGEGPDGAGITVHFRPGINRVAGRNGHGKTTLIEALGYALFLCEPHFEERFALQTYFLRAGEKEGEIDVTFERGEQSYRVERGVGQGKRRSKVVQLSDLSTCAEGDEAVAGWLCRLLASDKHRLTGYGQLSELFSNLVGIKQGRLNRPFDCRPKEAKNFFDPLLDVAIFGECTGLLSDAQRHFNDLLKEQNLSLATIEERIRGCADSFEKLPVKEAQLDGCARMVEKGRKQKEAAEQCKAAYEQKEKDCNAAAAALETGKNQLRLASQRRETDEQQLRDSQEAAALLKRHDAGFKAYGQAEARLRALQQQQNQKTKLQQQRAEAFNAAAGWAAKKDFATKQALECSGQLEAKTTQADSLRRELAEEDKRLQESQAEFERVYTTSQTAQRARDALENWRATLGSQVDQNERAFAGIIQDAELIKKWDGKALLQARSEEKRLEEASRDLARKLAKAEEAKGTLAGQLAQIGGGICPFLKEKCRQFDAKVIQSDLKEHQKNFAQLTIEHNESMKLYEGARAALAKLADQENELTHVKKNLHEKTRNLVDRHTQLFPALVRNHVVVLKNFGGAEFDGIAEWLDISPADFFDKCESSAGVEELRPLIEAQRKLSIEVGQACLIAGPRWAEQFATHERERQQRLHRQRDLENGRKNLRQGEAELKALVKKISTLREEEAKAAAETKVAAARVEEFDAQLKDFSQLDQEFVSQNELKDKNEEAYRCYLGATSSAGRLQERADLLKAAREREVDAKKQMQQRQELYDDVRRGFEAELLEKARMNATEAAAKLAVDEKSWQTAERELQEEKKRLKQWKEACAARNKVREEMGRLEAAAQLSRLAGKVLKDAAPAVAQHLCSRIACGAQRIFNLINQDPIELEWKAEPQYSLRVSPGDRRFAMLSGGEQTKLALAMTLAMIEQFSGLRFAVFDEPTYGVDAESREKLADAIIASEQAAHLEQLIVVSHDNAFEGKIEHVVLLNKTAALGTEIVTSD